MSFLGEIKRRNVVKVGAAYLLLAWLIAQVVSVLNEPLNLPDWFDTVLILLLAAGFPVALFFAWAYELVPEGIKGTESAERSDNAISTTGQKLNYAIISLLLVAVIFMFVDNYIVDDQASLSGATSAIQEDAISSVNEPERDVLPNAVAVLPLENLTRNPDDAFYADGVHVELITQLSKLGSLNVIVRDSVLRYGSDRPPLSQIAAELNVQSLLTGSFRYEDGQVRVEVSLVDPETSTAMWSEVYQEDFSEIFAVQADISMNVANSLNARFSSAEQTSIERVPTDSNVAYALYLSALNSIGVANYGEAMRQFDLAILNDSRFAEAYAQRAIFYAYSQITSVGRFQILSSNPEIGEAFAALAVDNAARALELHPEVGAAWVARALTHNFHLRWNDAEQAYMQAYTLSPNDIVVLREYAAFQQQVGNLAAATDLIDRALQLDPNGILTLVYAAQIKLEAGSVMDALSLARRAVAVDPANPMTNLYVGLWESDAEEKERYLRTSEQLSDGHDAIFLQGIAAGYLQIGLNADAERALDGWEAWASEVDLGAGDWAQYYVLRGDMDSAYERLLEAVEKLENGEADAGHMALGITFSNRENPLFAEARFQRLLDRLDALRNPHI